MYANDHDHNTRAMTVLRGRNIQVRQVGSKIRVIGTAKEAEDMRAREEAGFKLNLYEGSLVISIVLLAIYATAYQLDALIRAGLV